MRILFKYYLTKKKKKVKGGDEEVFKVFKRKLFQPWLNRKRTNREAEELRTKALVLSIFRARVQLFSCTWKEQQDTGKPPR